MSSRSETAVRAAGLAIFVGFIPLVLGVPAGRSLFWTVGMALLPLGFTLAGFYAWRRVCPLAIFGQLGRLVGRPGKRKAGDRLARIYPLVQLGILVAALSMRHIAINGTAVALAAFLVGLTLAAVVTSFVTTGKTWCNYLCPVGLVEKLYSEPIVLRSQENSQCTPCTACKKSCPDIDVELGYWKEADLPARRLAYFAWPGVVLGFYAYFWLHSGSIDTYFGGAWAYDDDQAARALEPGFFFAPWVPRAVAAPLTILLFGAASVALASVVEGLFLARAMPPADKARIRHRALAVCGFIGFVLFYSFAGQPTLHKLPAALGTGFAIATVAVGMLVLVRRWDRREDDYVQEKFARGILKRWEWGDEPPAEDLGGIYLLHTERQKQREGRVAAYKETLVDMITDGVLSRNEVALMAKLRGQLGISDREHDKVLAELSSEARLLFDPEFQGSAEKRLMIEQLRGELERLVIHGADAATLDALRVERGISVDDFEAVLAELRAPAGAVGEKVRETLAAMSILRRAQAAARLAKGGEETSQTVSFFVDLVEWRLRQHADRGRALLAAVHEPEDAVVAELRELAGGGPAASGGVGDLVALCGDGSAYVRAAAAHVLSRFDEPDAQVAVAAATVDGDALVRETAVRALGASGRLTREIAARAMNDPDSRVTLAVTRVTARASHGFATLDREAALDTLSTFDSMTLLHGVPLFARLAPDDLEQLSHLTRERRFAAAETLCVEGEEGRDVFVLVEGRARAWVRGPDGSPRTLGESGPGDCIGEMAALDEAPRTATVTAMVDSRAMVLSGAAFNELLAERPEMAREMVRVLSGRLRGMIAVRNAS